MSLKKMLLLSMLVAMALVLAYLEFLLPPFFFPGMKLGLANGIILLTLVQLGKKEALMVSILRLLILSIFLGRLFSPAFLLGLAGALFSLLAMVLAEKTPLSLIGVSMAGAVFHNLGQILMASFVLDTLGVFYLLPLYLLAGLAFGLVTGFLVSLLIRHQVLKALFSRIENQ